MAKKSKAKSLEEKNRNIADAFIALEKEHGLTKDVLVESLKTAIEKTYKRTYMSDEATIRLEMNPENLSDIRIFEIRTVVDDLMDEDLEMSLEEAQEINPNAKVGDIIETEGVRISRDEFSRIATKQVKSLLHQSIREAEKDSLFEEYQDKQDEIITGIIDRVEPRFAIINIGRMGAMLPVNLQIPGETLKEGDPIRVYVTKVEKTTKATHVDVSRVDPNLVKRLFELEVPEIKDGKVEIMSVSREAGDRTKISVHTNDANIDPIGSCVGPRGARVRAVVDELNGEMIDIVRYSTNPVEYIRNALSPAEVLYVITNEETKTAIAIVNDNELSLAIGKRGQNARLAVKLTSWGIDVKSLSVAKEMGLELRDSKPKYAPVEDIVEEEIIEEVEEVVEETTAPVVEETTPVEEEVKAPKATVKKEKEFVYTPSTPKKPKAVEKPVVKEEVAVEEEDDDQQKFAFIPAKPEAMPIYTEDEDYDYEYEDDDLSKYDEDIDYDAYDEYYDQD